MFGDGWFIQRGMKVFIAMSILGNFISFTYGVARVKQEIAKLRILPFSKFWAKQSHYDTPVGALILHWIFAALIIVRPPPLSSPLPPSPSSPSPLFVPTPSLPTADRRQDRHPKQQE